METKTNLELIVSIICLNWMKFKLTQNKYRLKVMQEANDALIKLQTVTLSQSIRSLQCSWDLQEATSF